MALADAGARRYAYADLEMFPDDRLRREIIDGQLIVTPSPAVRHQRASANIHYRLFAYSKEHGGLALAAPTDVILSDSDVVEPDLLFVGSRHADRVGAKAIEAVPDLVIEISSPSTRRLELVRKRELYERFLVPEYWYVDLDVDRVEIYTLTGGIYPAPAIRYPGETLCSSALPGFTMPATEALALEPEPAPPNG
jgi:Uma2 family endonuclease